ncbi:MAG: cell filamentation protein Fic, partial [Betaproteobacteria bacterium]
MTGNYRRDVLLPDLKVMVWKGLPPLFDDLAMQGRKIYFPSLPRLLLENLSQSTSSIPKTAGKAAVEQRLLSICDARGEEALIEIRETARLKSKPLLLEKEFRKLDDLIGSILGTRTS